MTDTDYRKLTANQLERLLAQMIDSGYWVYGPTFRDEAIVYQRVHHFDEIATGYHDFQEAGYYRLKPADDGSYFGYVPAQDSWKRFLFAPEEILYRCDISDDGVIFKTQPHQPSKRAFFGIRSCELHAIAVQDRVFIGDYTDPSYAAKRDDLLFVAINCTRSASTCFCSSLDTGPRAKSGFDVSLTEVCGPDHYFILEVGSEKGAALVEACHFDDAEQADIDRAHNAVAGAAQQVRRMPAVGLKETIEKNMENQAFWDDIANRCLACANCTLVCPTCFCANVEDKTDLTGDSHERVRYWDSCFNSSHSHLAGGSVRTTQASRYRQWFTHKLASWQDQFDTLGCTGCGRCITWCPVGIDITAEAHRLCSPATTDSTTSKEG